MFSRYLKSSNKIWQVKISGLDKVGDKTRETLETIKVELTKKNTIPYLRVLRMFSA